MTDRIKALEDALTLAANRLHRIALDFDTGSRRFIEVLEWADEARAASQPVTDCHQPNLVTSDDGQVSEWPSDEPRQIVCTGEEGSDVWNCAFGTWSADDFGIDSDEPVGNGERLFVNRRLYDAAIARAIKAEATIAALPEVQALIAQLRDRAEKAEVEADFFKSEIKLRNKILDLGCVQAMIAGAYEAAASVVDRLNREGPYQAIGAASEIRALIPADAIAARDAMIAEAVARGGFPED